MSQSSPHASRTSRASATKALVAAGLGVVLLAGAGGTFAIWSDDATVAGETITDGELKLAVEEGSWSVNEEPVADISTFRMVPGDTLVYETNVVPTIVGDNLRATLTGTMPEANGSFWEVTTTLPDGNAPLTAADNGAEVPVKVEVSLPEGSENESQTESLNLGEITLNLVQVTSTP